MRPLTQLLSPLLLGGLILALTAGCASTGSRPPKDFVVKPGEQTYVFGLGPEDIDFCATKIAASLSQLNEFKDPTLQPHILVELPALNTRDRQMSMDAPIFTRRLTTALIKTQGRKAHFISREDLERLEKERIMTESVLTPGNSDPKDTEYRSADFFLFSKIEDLTRHTVNGKVVTYLLCTFRLVDAKTSLILWQDDYQITKRATMDKAYQ